MSNTGEEVVSSPKHRKAPLAYTTVESGKVESSESGGE
jgi:hypothetical protein